MIVDRHTKQMRTIESRRPVNLCMCEQYLAAHSNDLECPNGKGMFRKISQERWNKLVEKKSKEAEKVAKSKAKATKKSGGKQGTQKAKGGRSRSDKSKMPDCPICKSNAHVVKAGLVQSSDHRQRFACLNTTKKDAKNGKHPTIKYFAPGGEGRKSKKAKAHQPEAKPIEAAVSEPTQTT